MLYKLLIGIGIDFRTIRTEYCECHVRQINEKSEQLYFANNIYF